ncbi:MAG: LUD domain-containing protein, partial [Planctomycetales bacterium]|nr:LUD domain-containing protein [Planctomycetales bacterium]
GRFASLVAAVGGVCHQVASWDEARQVIEALPPVQNAGGLESPRLRVVCEPPSLQTNLAGLVDLDRIDDPHDLADVELAIVAGHFGVAENGAIWVTDERIRHRAVYFLSQHVVVVLPGDALVHNLHEAYRRIKPLESGRFGMFLSGPSKTADIEQSLVIGAHGARSLTVLRIAEWR